jgi:signal transduction histidine kinase
MRSLAWFHDGLTGSAPRLRRAGWLAGLAVGLCAEWLAGSGQSPGAAAADLVVGWTLIGSGLTSWSRRPQSGVGPVLALAGFTWFCGTLAASRIGIVATIGTALLFLHRGPLCHAIIRYPGGRPPGRSSMIVVAGCYVYAAAVPLARSDMLTIGVAIAVLAATLCEYGRAAGPDRRARVTAVAAAAALAIPLAGGSAWRLMGAGPAGNRAVVLWAYQAAVVLIAAGLLSDLLWGRWTQAAVTKLVVDLGGDADAGTLRTRLAEALGDQSLVIGYWLAERGGYVDERGNRVDLPRAGTDRAVTMVGGDGEQVAALVHDVAVLNDQGLVGSVAGAAKIALSNVRLRAEMQRRVAELEASRRRIVVAADAQRRRFQQQLETSAGQRLAAAGEYVDLAAREAKMCGDRSAGHLAAVRETLAEARAELAELAAGIHPALLTEQGLRALASLAGRSPVHVRLVAPDRRLPGVIETAVYFACSEALANVAKHAGATRAEIDVRIEGDLVTVVVTDDGKGGADPSDGFGLKGIADRAEALGGRLVVRSPAGGGTRLVVQIPTARSTGEPEAPG